MKSIFLGIILATVVFIGINADVQAGFLPGNWKNEIDIQNKLPSKDVSGTDGSSQLKTFLTGTIFPVTKNIMMSIAILYATILIAGLSISGGEEDTVTESKTKIGFLVLGLVAISLSEPVSQVLDPTISGENIGDASKFENTAVQVVDAATILIGGIAVLMMTISGIKLLVSKGEEGAVGDQKRNFVYSLVGLIIVLISKNFILGIIYRDKGVSGPNAIAAAEGTQEIMGVIAYALQYLALGAVGVLILAGVFYVFSMGDDEAVNRAKGIMKSVIIGLIVIMMSYTIVSTFMPG